MRPQRSQSAGRIFGYAADEIVGRYISLLIPPCHVEDVVRIMSKIRRGERVDHFETKRRAKNGRILDFSIIVSPNMQLPEGERRRVEGGMRRRRQQQGPGGS